MSEARARATLVSKLRVLDAQPIEVKGRSGVPDIEHIYGWIEVKYRPRWPVHQKHDTIIKFPHKLMPAQKVWLRKRVSKGGAAVLCAKVERDWFFWDVANYDLELFDNQTAGQMIAGAHRYYRHNLNHKDLIEWLISLRR